mgnify:CR=1 FL=1
MPFSSCFWMISVGLIGRMCHLETSSPFTKTSCSMVSLAHRNVTDAQGVSKSLFTKRHRSWSPFAWWLYRKRILLRFISITKLSIIRLVLLVEYEKNSKKINIYVIGDIDPVSYIPVDEDLTEKEFHYEIMTWSIQKGCWLN